MSTAELCDYVQLIEENALVFHTVVSFLHPMEDILGLDTRKKYYFIGTILKLW